MDLASEERSCLLDTGPLVSFFASGLRQHSWTCEQWKFFRPLLLTCEPVLTEAAFLLKREGREADPLFALLERGVIRIALDIQEEQADLRALMRRYRNRPVTRDACLVRLSEIETAGEVFTLDCDFRVYRRQHLAPGPARLPHAGFWYSPITFPAGSRNLAVISGASAPIG